MNINEDAVYVVKLFAKKVVSMSVKCKFVRGWEQQNVLRQANVCEAKKSDLR